MNANESIASPAGEINPRVVKQWLDARECVLIDVREPDEHAREHIKGATLLPLSKFQPRQVAEFAKPGKKLVFHCRGGKRSADACRMSASLGAGGATILSMTGGIEAWKKDGLSVEVNTSVAGISVMRQVQLVIGLCVVIGSALAWFHDPRWVAVPAFFGLGLIFAGATGTCALAKTIGWMPWNRARPGTDCSTGSCK